MTWSRRSWSKPLQITPKDASTWSTRALAERDEMSRQTVNDIWRAFGLKPLAPR
jgi:hypothetical protein